MQVPTRKLISGFEIPVLGLGTYNLTGRQGKRAILSALQMGYKHIDTAAFYRNEKQVANAIKDSGIDRADIFVTSKVWSTDLGTRPTKNAFNRSITLLNLDYLDLYLIHWPGNSSKRRIEAFKVMQTLRDEGQIRSIGVSNFSIAQIEEITSICNEVPAVNQVRFSPHHTDFELLDYCIENNIQLTAYTPLNKGKVDQLSKVKPIAEKYGKSISQIVLRWLVQLGTIPIPKASQDKHLQSNIDIFDFEITQSEMDDLSTI